MGFFDFLYDPIPTLALTGEITRIQNLKTHTRQYRHSDNPGDDPFAQAIIYGYWSLRHKAEKPKPDTYVRLVKEAAWHDHALGQWVLGHLYLQGKLVFKDYQKAHLWMVLAISRDGLSSFLDHEFLPGITKHFSLKPEKMYSVLGRTIEKGHLSMAQLDQNYRLINGWLEKLVLSPEDLDWGESVKSEGEHIRSDNAYLFEEML